MALLINKLFSKKKVYCKHQDACERAFTFSQDQVRVILFRECDFRGRKLLFDSHSVQRVSVSSNATKNEGFVEISNGYGYQYLRPNADIGHLGEIVFGSVAMSFRGTSFKIHNFTSPAKLICSQVFQGPKNIRGRPHTVSLKSNNSTHSLEKSGKFDCSNTSSTTSFNDHFSGNSTESDIKILSPTGSVPLDVPTNNYVAAMKFAPSLECDSGFCGELSYNSVSSGPPSLWDTRQEGIVQNFSCGSLYKRWLRSTSTSLDNNGCSDNSLSGVHTSSLSTEESVTRGHRSVKLGLAVIVHLTESTAPSLEKFLLEHSALLEAMVHRARIGSESAYTRPSNFVSIMFEIVRETSQWLLDLITGPVIGTYFWHALSIHRSQADDASDRTKDSSEFSRASSDSSLVRSKSVLLTSDRNCPLRSSMAELDLSDECARTAAPTPTRAPRNDLFGGNVGRLRSACFSLSNYSSPVADKFIRDLCELIESTDVKHTNFFMSTLLTAVLTNHLGWVSTVLLPTDADRETFSSLAAPCNPLWGQLTDLYGAVGTPTKTAHTIVCGSNKVKITKILNTLTYFIRCSAIECNQLSRYDVPPTSSDANQIAPSIQMLDPKVFTRMKPNNLRMLSDKFQEPQGTKTDEIEMDVLKVKGDRLKMSRTKSCLENLSLQSESLPVSPAKSEKSDHPLLDKITHLGFSASTSDKTPLLEEAENLIDFKEASEQVLKIFSHNCTHNTKLAENDIKNSDKSDVIFVLGDNEALVGIKKTDSNLSSVTQTKTNEQNIPSSSKERPKDLNISMRKPVFTCDSSDSSPNASSESIKSPFSDTSPCSECEHNQRDEPNPPKDQPSTSKLSTNTITVRSSVVELETCDDNEKHEIRRREDFNRSQSVPPSDKSQRKCSKHGCKIKYSGVKFNFKQYPQIVTNYMKSKNLELSQLPFADKALKLNKTFSASMYDCSKFDCPNCDCEGPNGETLQTPSNASELEFSSELMSDNDLKSKDKNSPTEPPPVEENNAIFEHEIDTFQEKSLEINDIMVCTEIPMPRLVVEKSSFEASAGYTHTLLRGVSDKYVSDMVLQGTTLTPKNWENNLRRDLALEARKSLLDQPVQEAVAIVANTDTWDVQLVSSHTFIVEKGSSGVQVGMSQLVANMLESLLQLWKLRTPPEYCLMHLESKLREFCFKSKSLAQLLLSTEFCNMDFLTSSLQLEVNDVPLLMAVASTHTPQVTQKYGLSFQ